MAALARNFTAQLGDLPSDSRAALERLIGVRDARESLPPDLEQRALFTGLRSLLSRASPRVGLLFDDLQWADDATLRFLGWCLSEPMPVKQFTVLITLRSTEAARGDVPGLVAEVSEDGDDLERHFIKLEVGKTLESADGLEMLRIDSRCQGVTCASGTVSLAKSNRCSLELITCWSRIVSLAFHPRVPCPKLKSVRIVT